MASSFTTVSSRPHAKRHRETLTAVHYRWLALCIALLTAYGSVIPCNFQPMPLDKAVDTFKNLAYFAPSLLDARGDWVITILQFAALSYLLMASLCVDQAWDAGLGGAAITTVLCVNISVGLEFLQVFFPPRTVSQNDIMMGCAGVFAGIVIWLAFGQRSTNWFRRVWATKNLSKFALLLLPGYLVFLFIIELMPFDFVLTAQEIAVKCQQGKVWLLPFSYQPATFLEWGINICSTLLLFLPLGFLKAFAPGSQHQNQQWREVLLFALSITGFIEVLQLFVYSRFFDSTDILLNTAAILLGWRLAQVFQSFWKQVQKDPYFLKKHQHTIEQWSPKVMTVAVLLWIVLLLYASWTPFNFTTNTAQLFANTEGEIQSQRMTWFPLADYYWGSKYQAFTNFLFKSLIFVPLGIFAAILGAGKSSKLAILQLIGLSLAAALIIETGQYFLPQHHPSTTDIFIECFGACLGFTLARHTGNILKSGLRQGQ